MGRRTSLDARTRLILGLAASGMGNGEIAAHLGDRRDEVDRHVRDAVAALGARSRLEAAVVVSRLGLIHPSTRGHGHTLSLVPGDA